MILRSSFKDVESQTIDIAQILSVQALKGTNMLANTLGVAVMECADGKDLQIFEPPEAMPDLVFRVIWKTELDADPALTWLRGIVLQTIEDVFAEVEEWIATSNIIQPHDVQR